MLPLVLWPDARLRLTCTAVDDFGPDLTALARDMLATMYGAQGRGLAAPQVGRRERLFVMDAAWKSGPPAPRVLVNPVILAVSDRAAAMTEGCLSIPGMPRRIARPDGVTLRWQDVTGAAQEATFAGIEAVIVQHEFDHLNGVLILDRPEAGEPQPPLAETPQPGAPA